MFLITSCVIAQKFFEFLTMYKSSATHFGIINATTRSCGELWLVEGCPHMNPPLPLYQPQLDTWASYGIYCAKICGTGLIFQPFDTTIGHPINTCLYFTFKSLLLYISSSVLHFMYTKIGDSSLLCILGKIFGIMPLFPNYIGACPCFDT